MPKRFEKPTVLQLSSYCAEIGLPSTEGEKIYDYFEEVGWKVGRTLKPMVDWKAAVRNWKRNIKEWKGQQTVKTATKPRGGYVDQRPNLFTDPTPMPDFIKSQMDELTSKLSLPKQIKTL